VADLLEFFGLASEPFENAGMHPLVLETGPLRRAVEWARSELAEGKSLLCIHGAKGVGKSRLAFALPHVLSERTALVSNPTVSWQEIEGAMIEQLEISALSRKALRQVPGSRSEPPVIVVDRAESVSSKTFRRFLDLQKPFAGTKPLVAFVFLADEQRITPQLRQAHATCTLAPLQPREIRRYLEARLLNSGYEGDEVFPQATCQAIYDATLGITSGIDLLCTTLLVEAARCGAAVVQPDLVASSCSDDKAPALAPTEQVEAPQQAQTAPADTTQSSDADLPRRRDAGEATASEQDLPAGRYSLGHNIEDTASSASEDRSTTQGDDAPGSGDAISSLANAPEMPQSEARTGQETTPVAAALLQAIATRWRTLPEWVSFGAAAAGAGLLTAVVIGIWTTVSTVDTGDSTAPVTPVAPQTALPSQPTEELAGQTPFTADSLEAHSVVGPHEEAEAAEVVEVASHAAVDVIEAIQPQMPGVVSDPAIAVSDSLELAAAGEVTEAGAPPAAPAALEGGVSAVEPAEPAEPQPSPGARSSERPVPAAPQEIVWPQEFLDAQRQAAPSPSEPAQLEIMEPDLARPSRGSR
jgi:type II secretory pathway predicted ATPase ExeA